MQGLIAAASAAGYQRMSGSVLGVNTPMRVLMQGLGFAAHPSPGDSGVLEYTLDLSENRVQLS